MCDHNCNQGRNCNCGDASWWVYAIVVLVWVVAAVASAAVIVWG